MPRLEIKRKIGQYWPSDTKARKVILLYHSIGDSTWGIQEDVFRDQVNWLTDHCRVLSLTDLLCAESSTDLQVAITFDDGYQSLHQHAAAILLDKAINATVYLNTGWISETQKQRKASEFELGHYPAEFFMTWPEVKDLHNAKWEIGSHGVNHYNFAQLQDDVMLQELGNSKKDIEDHLQNNCVHFAYPWGKYSSTTQKTVKKANYQYAAGARHGKLNPHSDLLAFPRINIAKDYSLKDFKNIIVGKWDYLGIIQRIKGL